MRVVWLELRDFRSYDAVSLEPGPGVNVFIGDNGAGKTNLLEAIGYLSALRSFRGAPDAALIRDGASGAVIRGGIERASGEVRVEIEIPAEGRRRILVNGKRPRRHGDVAAGIPMVAFLPDDLDLVKRGPAQRRDYLDDLGARLSPSVGANLVEFEKALRQRNTLLRREGPAADLLALEAWDERVATAGARVVEDRLDLIEQLRPVLGAAHSRAGGGSGIEVRYASAWAGAGVVAGGANRRLPALTDSLREALSARRVRDLEQRTTTAGPHRDEPIVELDGRSSRSQASQGEQRTIALSLRLAAYDLLAAHHDTAPVLLLDDVLSELDPTRAAAVLELLPRGQVFVTTARDDDVAAVGWRWTRSGHDASWQSDDAGGTG